jgi:glycosyltransferase involved in cell wall biosynthesis
MVAVEALQNGLAIVTTRIGGMRDLVDEGSNGFLCEISPAALALRLRELLRDEKILRRMRRASLEKAGNFDLEKSTTAYESVLEESAKQTS